MLAVALVGALSLILSVSAASGMLTTSTKTVTLTVWNQGDLNGQGIQWLPTLVKSFEKAHPGVRVNLVSKPINNFIALLRTAIISKSAPDVVGLYPGAQIREFQSNLTQLNQYIAVPYLKRAAGIQYFAPSGRLASGTFAVPTENQFYIMFYNRTLFKQAGITAPPTTFQQALADGKALKAHGIQPWAYGAALGAPNFIAAFDWSYLLAGAFSLKQWNGLLNGKIPYTSPNLVSALDQWQSIYSANLTNSNALNASDTYDQFQQGKAAMVMSYSGFIPTFQKALGAANVGVMPPPWTTGSKKMLVGMPGYGYAVLKSSKQTALAAAFARAIISNQAQQLAANAGQIPVVSTVKINNPLQRQLAKWVVDPTVAKYPMFDNFMQPAVNSVMSTQIPAVFVGQTSVSSATSSLRDALDALQASERNVNYHLGGA
jgi:raffinose/stachyose/melibiose transport system substrate-binding protein